MTLLRAAQGEWMRTIFVWLAVLCGVRSAALAQTTLNVSEDLVRLGIASTNIVPNQPETDTGLINMHGFSACNTWCRLLPSMGALTSHGTTSAT